MELPERSDIHGGSWQAKRLCFIASSGRFPRAYPRISGSSMLHNFDFKSTKKSPSFTFFEQFRSTDSRAWDAQEFGISWWAKNNSFVIVVSKLTAEPLAALLSTSFAGKFFVPRSAPPRRREFERDACVIVSLPHLNKNINPKTSPEW